MGETITIPLIFRSQIAQDYTVTAEVNNYGNGSVQFKDSTGQAIYVSGEDLDKINIVRKGLKDV